VAHKIDDEEHRVVLTQEGIEFAKEYGMLYVEASSATGENINLIFETIVNELEYRRAATPTAVALPLYIPSNTPSNTSTCVIY